MSEQTIASVYIGLRVKQGLRDESELTDKDVQNLTGFLLGEIDMDVDVRSPCLDLIAHGRSGLMSADACEIGNRILSTLQARIMAKAAEYIADSVYEIEQEGAA